MTGSRLLLAILAAVALIGCGTETAVDTPQDGKAVEKSQEDAMKAEGSIPN